MTDQALATLRGDVVDIVAGSVFLCLGAVALFIGVIRRRSRARIFLLLGIWSATYGAMQLTQSPTILSVLPVWMQTFASTLNVAMTYLIVVIGALSFRELSLGTVRRAMWWIALTGVAIAIAGFAVFVRTGAQDALILYNNLLAAILLAVLTVVAASSKLARKYLLLPDRGVLAAGTLIFAAEALIVNLSRPLGFNSPRLFDHLGFATLLFSLGYGGLQLILSSERRLLSIDNELAIAREIQNSILPEHVPERKHLRVAAAYHPMTAVAGDFYEFISNGKAGVGFLVADVSGHGVPAALIASMIKVAVQLVEPCADDPSAVLSGLNHALAGQLRGQLVSAAYLWLDTERGTGSYSAAGHPPLIGWRHSQLEQITSNGLLIGMNAECDNYPVEKIRIEPGDRFLLYTDGVTEPENAHGEAFGDLQLGQIISDLRSHSASQLSDRVISELRAWQPAAATQADDITLIVVDVV